MGAPCAGVQFAQHRKFVGGWGRGDGGSRRVFHLPAGGGIDRLARHARMDRHHGHFLTVRVGFEHAKIGDEAGRPLGLHAQAGAVIAAIAMAKRGDEIELLHEAALALRHGDENFPARDGDLRGAAAAGSRTFG